MVKMPLYLLEDIKGVTTMRFVIFYVFNVFDVDFPLSF